MSILLTRDDESTGEQEYLISGAAKYHLFDQQYNHRRAGTFHWSSGVYHGHWLTVSTLGQANDGEEMVYDSLYSTLSLHVKKQIQNTQDRRSAKKIKKVYYIPLYCTCHMLESSEMI